jgi:tetratricopeptide (TPR) repeat protein
MYKTLETAQKYVLYATLGLLSIFFLFNNTSPFVIPKAVLLVTGASLIILLWVAKMFVNGTFTFHIGKFDLGVLLIAIAYFASTFVRTPNKMEAYLLPGTTTFVLAGAVIYFLINQFDAKVKHNAKVALFLSGVLLSIFSLFSVLNIFSKIPQLPAIMKDPGFNLLGGAIPAIILLVVLLVLSVSIIISESDTAKKTLYGFGVGIMLFALTVLVISSLPGRTTTPRFLSNRESWEVAVETLKKSPLMGVGPANYLTGFNLFKPLAYNQTDLWQVRFTTASNFYFTLITETGFLGLFAIALLLIAVYRYVKNDLRVNSERSTINKNLSKLALTLMVLLFAFLPTTPLLFVYFLILLAIVSESEHKNFHLNIASGETSSLVSSRIPVIIVGLPFVAGILALMFFGVKVLKAEATFAKSINALSQNDAKTTYDLMNNAIRQNPRVDRYHASFAQVNMALASSIASKEEITDADRTAISQLVQQAINEGKATVSLNPGRSGNWEVLAQTYRSIMPFAQGADQFAVQTFTQAIALDPTNPNLRISLGGVYYSLGNFDAAIESFKLAVIAKPDHANAHYNLAIAFREKKDYDNAIAAINNVLQLVQPNTQDYNVAKQTLDELQSKKQTTQTPARSGENLTPPEPQEQTNINPPITLPEEANPPESPEQ